MARTVGRKAACAQAILGPPPRGSWRAEGIPSRVFSGMQFSRILVAIDDSPQAEHAADVARDLAAATKGVLAVVHVVDPRAAVNVQADLTAIDLLGHLRQDAARTLAAAANRLPIDGRKPETIVKEGSPDAEIIATAHAWKADVLVVGTHGRGGIGRVLLGSTAESIVRKSAVPVLVVRHAAV